MLFTIPAGVLAYGAYLLAKETGKAIENYCNKRKDK